MSAQQRTANPGSIHVRLGEVLRLRELALFNHDLAMVSDMQDAIFDYCSVYMDQAEQDTYEKMPGLAYGDERTDAQILADLRKKLRYVFATVKDHNVFSRAEVDSGDSSDLDEMIGAEAPAAG